MEPTFDRVVGVLEFSESAWEACTLRYLPEGRWNEIEGLLVRVDAARPEMNLRRHVAIALPKHVTAKNKQVSWNDLGQKHDKKTFNDRFARMALAKRIAKDELGLPPNAVLEETVPDPVYTLGLTLLEDAGNTGEYVGIPWLSVELADPETAE